MRLSEQITISVPSRIEHLDLVQRVAEETARLAGFSGDEQLDIGIAVREGAVNAMKHGHAFDPSLAVNVEFLTDADDFTVSIVDVGEGFDAASTPDPTQPENLWRTSGRGLLLIRSLVDDVNIKSNGTGVTLTLVKRRPEDRADSEAGAAN
ncbi:MAG: ATP-binding protein [Acidobacteriota bacterium]|nr:ATP-binding protein [Acidobacteriota bacterium]